MEHSKIFILEEAIQLGIRGLTRMENIILGLIAQQKKSKMYWECEFSPTP